MRRRSVGWTVRPCGTGCIASTPKGLVNRKPAGAAPKLTLEQKRALAALVEAGPDLETDGLVRWRRIDLKQVIRERFGADDHERRASFTTSAFRT